MSFTLERHQRCSTPDSWRAAPRPHHSAPCRPPLAAHTSAHPAQAVRTGLSVHSGVHRATCRTPSARSRVRNHGIACAPHHRPISSCRRRDVQQWAIAPSPSQHLELSAGRDPSQPISGCLQTFIENSLLYPEFFRLFLLLLVHVPVTL